MLNISPLLNVSQNQRTETNEILFRYRRWTCKRNVTSEFCKINGIRILKWMFNQIDEMGFEYESKGCSEILDLETLNKIQEEDEYLISSMDNSIIATGFGQIKITGKIDSKLKDLTIKALNRQMLLNEDDNKDLFYRLEKMKNDLANYK